MVHLTDLLASDLAAVHQTAQLLLDGFVGIGMAAWRDFAAALEEVNESLGPGHISRVALTAEGAVVGWVGGISGYGGYAWELHPLVVHPRYRRQGLGQALVTDFEAQVRARGGGTVYLGTDDEDQRTSLGEVDLYPHVLEHLAHLENRRDHPFAFYLKLGYTVVGVLPDASGPGKPDIFMAKRL
jgi:aminoglycoside 6'-N-acetyltransferase I